MFWQPATRIDHIASNFQVNQYSKIRNGLHVNAAESKDPGFTNPFWKVQPLIDQIRKVCLELPKEEFNSVDEQMVSFTGSAPAKQFVPKKPCPEDLKNFVICGSSERAVDFELYCGKGTGISREHKKLGLGGLLVMWLCVKYPKEL